MEEAGIQAYKWQSWQTRKKNQCGTTAKAEEEEGTISRTYLCNLRLDIEQRTYLTTSVKEPAARDMEKLNRVLKYLSNTSALIYIVLLTRGCTSWRPEAVMSTTRGVNKKRHRVFTDRRECTGRHKNRSYLLLQ